MPDVFVSEYEDGVTIRAPAERAEQDGVEQADVVDGKKVALLRIKAIHALRAAQVGQGEAQGRAQAEPPLYESQSQRGAGMRRHGDDFRR